MRKLIALLLAAVMTLSMTLALTSCKAKDEGKANVESEQDADIEDVTEDAEASEKTMPDNAVDAVNPEFIEKTIQPDAEDVIGSDVPLQIESVILDKDGGITIAPVDELKKNELGESKATFIAPFAESGTATDIYLRRIGDSGYRTILALMDDGTISAVNVRALIEDHIVAVMDTVGGRDTFVDVIDEKGGEGEGYSIYGVTRDGERVMLDPVLMPDKDPEPINQ